MLRRPMMFALAGLLSLGPASRLEAQAPAVGSDFGSARINVGMLAPTSTFTDPMFGESSFASGAALGASVLVFPWQGRWGIGANLIRSTTEGEAESEFAPMALNDPTQFLFTVDVAARQMYDSWFGYVAGGAGMKQYNWAASRHSEDRFFLWNVAAGVELRPAILGRFGLAAEVRSYHSKLIAFGIDDGTWEPGTPAQPLYPNIGFQGGVVGGQKNHDLLFTGAISIPF